MTAIPQGRPSSRRAILDAACARFAANPGASLSEIALAAGVGRATLHRLFGDRRALLRELALDALRACDEATSSIDRRAKSAAAAMRMLIEAIVPLGDRFRVLAADVGVLHDPEVAAHEARQRRELERLIELVKQDGLIDATVPSSWIVASLEALVYAAWVEVRKGNIAARDAASLVYYSLIRSRREPRDGEA